MALDPRQLGHEATMDQVRRLLVEQFRIAKDVESIPSDEPLFEVGVGLSSIEGMELLLRLETTFGVRIKDVEWWVNESPTLSNVADYLIKLSNEQS